MRVRRRDLDFELAELFDVFDERYVGVVRGAAGSVNRKQHVCRGEFVAVVEGHALTQLEPERGIVHLLEALREFPPELPQVERRPNERLVTHRSYGRI
jgi:hypothetical protein